MRLEQLFEDQARRDGSRVAVVGDSGRLTYAALDERAEQIAQGLRAAGAQPNQRVGLCMRRSADLIAAILGLYKAGCAYVALDPIYPQDRLDYIREDSGISLAIVDGTATVSDCRALTVAGLIELGQQEEGARADERPSAEAGLAYILYTSGSTGRPKGALVSHAHVLALLDASREYFEFSEGDVWSQVHAYGFDFTVWEIWGALAYGGRLVIVSNEDARNPERFFDVLAAEGVTVLNQTPAAFSVLADHILDTGRVLPELAVIIFGGEALDRAAARRWLERFGDEASPVLVNMYGITETTVHVTCLQIGLDDLADARTPIGPPLPHLDLYLLDEYLNHVPPGAAGEIYVGGAAVSWGYWNRGRLTAERFVPSPFPLKTGNRLYRSGDLAMIDQDGLLRYVGRADSQVKVRGYRIELGEIENALNELAWVRRAAVVTVPNGGTTSLAAYVLPAPEALPPSLESCQQALTAKLPAYMLPQQVALVAQLPLNENGKIDRAGLPELETCRRLHTRGYVPPSTPTEQRLAAIWAEILGVSDVGIDDNFFSIGGDSIRSIRVRARAQQLGIDVSIATLLRSQTIRALAEAVDGAGDQADADSPEFHRPERFGLLPEGATARLDGNLEDAFPITQAQLGLLYHSTDGEESSTYHNIEIQTLRVPFDEAALRAIWSELAERHEALRTGFDLAAGDEPLQLVYRSVDIPVQILDYRHLSPEEWHEATEAWLAGERRRLFDDWKRAPLFRVTVLRRTDDEFQLAYTNHHAVIDGWSVATLTRAFIDRYTARLAGRPAPLAAPAVPLSTFVSLERAAIRDEASKTFWVDQLAGVAATRLPQGDGEFATGAVNVDVPIDHRSNAALHEVASGLQVSLKAVLLGLHARALGAICGRDDVVTGLVTNGRPEIEGGEAMLGLFLNTLPFRVSLADGSWRELIESVFALERAMWPHRRYPMPLIKQAHGGATLFESIFNYTRFHVLDQADAAGVIVETGGGYERSNYPLVLQAMQLAGGTVRLVLVVDRAHFSAEQIERMAAVYEAALASLVADVEAFHGAADLLPAGDRARLASWSGDLSGVAGIDRGLTGLFAEVVAQHGMRVAVTDGVEALTYAGLDEASDAIARQLVAAGVGAGERVGVALARSPRLIAALLGVIKAGAAYVPLDPAYPEPRLARMAADAGVVLTLADEAPAWAAGRAWLRFGADGLERPDGSPAPAAADAPAAARGGGSAAYVMYTSGSTGEPKGVVVPDRGIVRLVHDSDYVEIAPDDVLLQMAPSAFDASTFEIWGALLNGATLAVAPAGTLALAEVAGLIERHEVSLMWLTAPLFHLMVDEEPGALASLRCLLAGGDALSAPHVRRYLALPGRRGVLVNGYGPTEATTFSCCHVMNAWEEGLQSVPIGRPIAHSSAHILDEAGRSVPVGTPGELCVGGAGLADGYWNQPRLTASRFVPDPCVAGGRLYRTGDRARFLADGRIEFLGRLDEQVKVRGHRIEPAEIEQALRGHPSLSDAAVAVRESDGHKRLVAYVVPRPGLAAPAAAELQEHLRARLPEPMVPALYASLERLPLTPNGKLDRAALPEALAAGPGAEPGAPPEGPIERALAEVWAEVLGLAAVGRHDNFFELGGDSILSIQIKARARERGLEFAVKSVFEQQTVARLAKVARNADGGDELPHVEPFSMIPQQLREELPEDIVDAYPLGQLQLGMVYHAELDEGSTLYNDVVVYTIKRRFDESAFRTAIAQLVERHDVLRTRISVADFDRPLQLVYGQADLRLTIKSLEGLGASDQQRRVDEWVRGEAETGFSEAEWPWLRVTVMTVAADEFRLGLSFHHAVLDGWSEATLVSDLLLRYERLLQDAPPLPSMPIRARYRDYIRAELTALQDAAVERQWQDRLRYAAASRLPDEIPAIAGATPSEVHCGAVQQHVGIDVPAPVADGLAAMARQLQVPLKSVLLTAELKALALATGRPTATTGVAVHVRPAAAGGADVIGLFLNTLPLTVGSEGASWPELIRRVFAEECKLEPLKAYPYPALVRANGGRAPFGVLFNFTQFHIYRSLGEGGIDVGELLDSRMGMAENSFPLTVTFQASPATGAIDGAVSGRRDTYDPETLQRFAALIGQVLTSMVRLEEAVEPTANGKPHAALAAAPTANADAGRDSPPEGPLEEALAAVWAEVLELPRVGRHDNFFELGGDSIAATRINSRIRKRLGLQLKVSRLYQAPTVAAYAASLQPDPMMAVEATPWAEAPPSALAVARADGTVAEPAS